MAVRAAIIFQSFGWDAMDDEHFFVKNFSGLLWTMAVLLALSRRTGRIFIMSKLIGEEGGHYLWTAIDFEPVEEMGIDFRETMFLHNKKSWHSKKDPFRSAARAALAPLEDADKEGTMYGQHPIKSTGIHGIHKDQNEIKALTFNDNTIEENALDAWWALHTAIPEVDSAELLLVNPHFISSSKFEAKITNGEYTPSVAEKDIFEVYKLLTWCPGNPIVRKKNIIGRSSAEMSCHGKGFPSGSFPPTR